MIELFGQMWNLQEVNIVSSVLRIGMSLLFGGILGLERGIKHHAAGFRTYMLVSVGAAMVMMTNQYVFQMYSLSDPVRMGAQVVSGIGFLGAGTILVTRQNQVRGLTTAAGLWVAACMGIAVGIGFYYGAIVGYIAVFIIMTIMNCVSKRLKNYNMFFNIYAEFDSVSSLGAFLSFAQQHQMEIVDIKLDKNGTHEDADAATRMTLKCCDKIEQERQLQMLSRVPGLCYREEI